MKKILFPVIALAFLLSACQKTTTTEPNMTPTTAPKPQTTTVMPKETPTPSSDDQVEEIILNEE